MGDLYALDFDGVLCDSCGESSISAVKVSLFNSHTHVFANLSFLCKRICESVELVRLTDTGS